MSPISIPGKVTLQKFTMPDIVTDNLVLYLDAANPRSYPGTGTAWTDLSNNGNNGTLINGPTYNSSNLGSIVFDGVNDYAQVTGSITTPAATFVVWIKRNGNQSTYHGTLLSRNTTLTGLLFQSSNQLGYAWNGAPNTYNWQSGLSLPDLTWCMCAVSVPAPSTPGSTSLATAYLCQSSGITSATNLVGHASTVIDGIHVGADAGTRFFTGEIAQALIYNRALTAAEVTKNFNALKWRYGL